MKGKKNQHRSTIKSSLDNHLPNKDYYMNVKTSDSQKTNRQINSQILRKGRSKSKLRSFSVSQNQKLKNPIKPSQLKKQRCISKSIKRTRSSTILYFPKKFSNSLQIQINSLDMTYDRIVDLLSSYQSQYQKLIFKNEQLKTLNKKLKRKKKMNKK